MPYIFKIIWFVLGHHYEFVKKIMKWFHVLFYTVYYIFSKILVATQCFRAQFDLLYKPQKLILIHFTRHGIDSYLSQWYLWKNKRNCLGRNFNSAVSFRFSWRSFDLYYSNISQTELDKIKMKSIEWITFNTFVWVKEIKTKKFEHGFPH